MRIPFVNGEQEQFASIASLRLAVLQVSNTLNFVHLFLSSLLLVPFGAVERFVHLFVL